MALTVQRLTKKFGELAALEDVSFSVEDGEFLCVIGPSGCGKTTLLRIIAGLMPPTDGDVILDSKKIQGPGRDRGFVFQEYVLFPWRSVEKNIEFGLELRGVNKEERAELVRRYVDMVKLRGFEDVYPKELSGGMQQRVAIARALVNDPKIILMDEPFGALDAQTRNLMQEELLRIWEKAGKTIVFVTHNVDEAVFLADRIVVLTARPAKVKQIVNVAIPRPRNRTEEKVNRIRNIILQLLEAEIKHPSERYNMG
ncbi:MAG: ABC transporter ATP-binding protein [Methanocellales archaeon]|nr:ABC transporter ATP-binding protein [Methanocellales archaeon]